MDEFWSIKPSGFREAKSEPMSDVHVLMPSSRDSYACESHACSLDLNRPGRLELKAPAIREPSSVALASKTSPLADHSNPRTCVAGFGVTFSVPLPRGGTAKAITCCIYCMFKNSPCMDSL